MGLIRAAIAATNSTFADQWKEYFYCDSIPADTLMVKGQKRVDKRFFRSSNKKGTENIISNGSAMAVNDGQCMIIVEDGKVVEFCAESGVFVWDTSKEPSIFTGSFGEGIKNTFKTIGRRFTFGGDAGRDQRVYYFNTKEIVGNKYGTVSPVPFRVVDKNIGLDVDISIRCNGEFSYKVTDPILFYTNVSGNVAESYNRSQIDSQLRTELLTALQPAFAKISMQGVRYSALPGYTDDICQALNEILSPKWKELRGIEIASFGMNTVNASKEDEDMLKELQKRSIMRDPSMAAATMVGAQADAMKMAASNKNGAMMGFMGLGMAQNAGGMNANQLFNMAQEQQKQDPNYKPVGAGVWMCSECGTQNTGKFCSQCGNKKPEANGEWKCSCGAVNTGKFCQECGAKRPDGPHKYKCDKCGWEPQDPTNPPKFCPECGNLFDENDIVG